MLLPFRQRAGVPEPPKGARAQGWNDWLLGSSAGRFLMGAGNSLRWRENLELRARLNAVVDGIDSCKDNGTGYIMGFKPQMFMRSENGDYGRAWVTQGLIEAGKAGNPKAFPLLRGFYDWFNDPSLNVYLPYLCKCCQWLGKSCGVVAAAVLV